MPSPNDTDRALSAEHAARFEPAFIDCDGVQVLRLDYRNLEPSELPAALERAGAIITSQPPRSVRALTLLDSTFDAAAAEALKRYASANAPYILASAVVAKGFWSAVVTSIKLHGRSNLALHPNEDAARAWLASADRSI